MKRFLLMGIVASLAWNHVPRDAAAGGGSLLFGHHRPSCSHRACCCPPEVIFVTPPAEERGGGEERGPATMPATTTQVITPYAMMGMPMMAPMCPAMPMSPVQFAGYRGAQDESARVKDDVYDCHRRIERVEEAIISLNKRMVEVERTLQLQTDLLKERFGGEN
jgi:hypothetical protein